MNSITFPLHKIQNLLDEPEYVFEPDNDFPTSFYYIKVLKSVSFKEEILNWMRKHNINLDISIYNNKLREYASIIISFDNKEDLTLFKLTWIL